MIINFLPIDEIVYCIIFAGYEIDILPQNSSLFQFEIAFNDINWLF